MSQDDTNVRVLSKSGGELHPDLKPIVMDYRTWKKKGKNKAKGGKPKYSRGLGDIQRLEGDRVHIAQTTARALSKSIDTYEEERQKSAKKKTNGAIEDFVNNSARATSAFLKESSDIPVDLANSVSRLSIRKNLRKGLRRSSKRIMKWPI